MERRDRDSSTYCHQGSLYHPTIPPASWLLPVCLALPCLPLEAVVWNGPLGRFGVVEEVTAQERGRGTRGAVSVAPFKFAGCSHPRVSLPAPSLCGAVGCPVPVSVSSLQSLGPCSPPRLPISCHCFGPTNDNICSHCNFRMIKIS